MKFKIEKMMHFARENYSEDEYLEIAQNLLNAEADIRHYAYTANEAYLGNFEAIKECDKMYNAVVSGMEYINEISKQILNKTLFKFTDKADEEIFILAYQFQGSCIEYAQKEKQVV